jgi:hypothetical protein
MQFPTSLKWFRRLIVLGAVVAAATASTAAAGVMIDAGAPVNVQGPTPLGLKAEGMRLQGMAQVYQSLSNAPTAQGLKADGLRLTGIAQVYQQLKPQATPDAFERYAASHPYGSTSAPDVFERYAASHPYGVGTAAAAGTDRIVDDWFRDPTPVATSTGDRIVDDSFRDPTPVATPGVDRIVDDSFRDAPAVVASPATGNGLDWEDFGIGAGAMLGLAALVAGLGIGAVAARHHRTGKLGTS